MVFHIIFEIFLFGWFVFSDLPTVLSVCSFLGKFGKFEFQGCDFSTYDTDPVEEGAQG